MYREFEELGIAAGKYNDGLLTFEELKDFAIVWLSQAPEHEVDILTGALAGVLADMERDR